MCTAFDILLNPTEESESTRAVSDDDLVQVVANEEVEARLSRRGCKKLRVELGNCPSTEEQRYGSIDCNEDIEPQNCENRTAFEPQWAKQEQSTERDVITKTETKKTMLHGVLIKSDRISVNAFL